MNIRKSFGLRGWVLGATAAGLISPTLPSYGQPSFILPKKSGAKPTAKQISTPPRLLPDADISPPLSSEMIQTAAQSQPVEGEKSEVQKQLEALYQQDGREMPNMSFNLQPINPAATNSTATNPTPGARSGQPLPPSVQKSAAANQNGYRQNQAPNTARTQASPYPNQIPQAATNVPSSQQPQPPQQPQAKRNGVTGFFKKMVSGANKSPAPLNPVPPDYANGVSAVPGVPPASTGTVATTPAAQTPQNSIPVQQQTANRPPVQTRHVAQPQLAATTQKVNAPTATAKSGQATQARSTISVAVQQPPQKPVQQPAQQPAQQHVQQPAQQQVMLPAPVTTLPILSHDPVPLNVAVVSVSPPPLMTEPQPQIIASAPREPETKIETTRPQQSVDDDSFNPFPDQPEAIASKVAANPGKQPGLLSETVAAEQPTTEVAATETPIVNDDPYSVRTKNFAEPSLDDRDESIAKSNTKKFETPAVVSKSTWVKTRLPKFNTSGITEPESTSTVTSTPAIDVAQNNTPAANPSDLTPPALNSPPALTPPTLTPPPLSPPSSNETNTVDNRKSSTDGQFGSSSTSFDTATLASPRESSDGQLEKMKKIRDRFGMKGLKGFCPVTLKDDRELLDAKPEFAAEHRGQKFHFASDEARQKFEADPSHYTPAAYGADVVSLLRDKDIVEGTLDYAAWYKGRLYLFGTQANYNVFVKSPVRYATPAGIEE